MRFNCMYHDDDYVKCLACGAEVKDDDCVDGVCTDCIHKLYNYADYLEYTESSNDVLDEFLETIFSASEIREILYRNLPKYDYLSEEVKTKIRNLVDYNDHEIARWLANGKRKSY